MMTTNMPEEAAKVEELADADKPLTVSEDKVEAKSTKKVKKPNKVYNVTVSKSDYTKEGNPVFKRMKIDNTSLYVLLIWLNRYIVWDESASVWQSKEFGGKETKEDYVFWFKLKSDADKAYNFLSYVKLHGVPNHWTW